MFEIKILRLSIIMNQFDRVQPVRGYVSTRLPAGKTSLSGAYGFTGSLLSTIAAIATRMSAGMGNADTRS
jgi:hypothetical protein